MFPELHLKVTERISSNSVLGTVCPKIMPYMLRCWGGVVGYRCVCDYSIYKKVSNGCPIRLEDQITHSLSRTTFVMQHLSLARKHPGMLLPVSMIQ